MAASEVLLTNGATPATPAAGKNKLFFNSSKQLSQVDDAGLVRAIHTNQDANTTMVGTTALAPLTMPAGSLLTVPAAGAQENDGAGFYSTVDVTNGRRFNDNWNYFRLTAPAAGITTIADVFGATGSGIPTVLNGVYEIEWHVYWVHTTTGTGTITWTIVSTTNWTNLVANYIQAAAAGIGTVAAPQMAGVLASAAAASIALPVTGVNTAVANHMARIHAVVECGTAGNIRLRMTASAGTATPSRDSYFKVRRLPAGNAGTFVA
jgi:hypothetical protein